MLCRLKEIRGENRKQPCARLSLEAGLALRFLPLSRVSTTQHPLRGILQAPYRAIYWPPSTEQLLYADHCASSHLTTTKAPLSYRIANHVIFTVAQRVFGNEWLIFASTNFKIYMGIRTIYMLSYYY